MRIKCLCEKCGGDNFKSMTSPLSFKYGSTMLITLYKCEDCGELYAIVPTAFSLISEQVVCWAAGIAFGVWFFVTLSGPEYETVLSELITKSVCLALLIYAALITLWNAVKSTFGIKPPVFFLVHIDENYCTVVYKDEKADYRMTADVLSNSVKKIREGTVYACTVGRERGAVKLLKYDIEGNRLVLELKNVSMPEDLPAGEEWVLIAPNWKKKICSGQAEPAPITPPK